MQVKNRLFLPASPFSGTCQQGPYSPKAAFQPKSVIRPLSVCALMPVRLIYVAAMAEPGYAETGRGAR